MAITSQLKCDRCGTEKEILGQANEATLLTGYGWEKIQGVVCCPNCRADVVAFAKKKAAPRADSGFTDGRPLPKGS
jgi:hypothetical protein